MLICLPTKEIFSRHREVLEYKISDGIGALSLTIRNLERNAAAPEVKELLRLLQYQPFHIGVTRQKFGTVAQCSSQVSNTVSESFKKYGF